MRHFQPLDNAEKLREENAVEVELVGGGERGLGGGQQKAGVVNLQVELGKKDFNNIRERQKFFSKMFAKICFFLPIIFLNFFHTASSDVLKIPLVQRKLGKNQELLPYRICIHSQDM